MSDTPFLPPRNDESARGNAPTPPLVSTPSRSRVWLYLGIAAVVVVSLLTIGILPRRATTHAIDGQAEQETNALPVVEVMTVNQGSAAQQLTLPGTVTPRDAAHIYARAAGYLKARYVDLGDKVHRGQLLAVISAPDLDATVLQQQSLVQQSKDALNRAKSQQNLEQVTYDRIHTLVLHGVLSQQDDDVALTALKVAMDDVHSAEGAIAASSASLAHSAALASFEQIRSPIDGTITLRNVEVGSLVSANGPAEGLTPIAAASQSGGPPSGGAQGNELFEVASLRDLLVFVTVPEDDAPFIQTGQQAMLTFSEMPSEPFTGTISRTSDSLSQQTRTLLLEIKVADPLHRLRPGMFASVLLHFNASNPGILISGDSVIPRAQGQFVAVVQNGIVHMREVHVGRDLGTQVYVTAGLRNGDVVIVNPTDSVKEGVHVTVLEAPKGQQK
jgi:multidrug efflux pump subunit AcrA (membrane-fusion protein)